MQKGSKMIESSQQQHFVLVHGACHGAWCWFKLKPLLEALGHKVTALDLAAAGINPQNFTKLHAFRDYAAPLLEFLAASPRTEKVILVGHSLGGMSVALAAEEYPEKVSVAVFLASFLPDTTHRPSYVMEQYFARIPKEAMLDTQFLAYGISKGSSTSILFGPECLSSILYQLCSKEDLELAKLLVRRCPLFIDDLSTAKKFSNVGYGSVKKVCIICNEDKIIPEEFQRWMIQSFGMIHVKELKNADHMAMLSRPPELCQSLVEIGDQYT